MSRILPTAPRLSEDTRVNKRVVTLRPGPAVQLGDVVSADVSADASHGAAGDPNLHRLWFALREKPWTSVVFVPTDRTVSTARLAELLATVAETQSDRAVRAVNAVGIPLASVRGIIESLEAATLSSGAVVAVDALEDNPASLPIVRSATAAILVARLGTSRLSSARATVAAVGADRVIGTIIVS